MIIPEISKDQLEIITELATRFLIMGKSSLFIVPLGGEDMDTETITRLAKKGQMAEELKNLEILIEVTNEDSFSSVVKQLKEQKKRTVKIYVISPVGLAIFTAVSDMWDDEDKKKYTERLEKYERDKEEYQKQLSLEVIKK
jgi:ABC-type phosphate/phosphonate transport system substrate-binding protein